MPLRNDDHILAAMLGICINPAHQNDYDQLGACLVCRVPTINGLHPTARARLLAKRPDLARCRVRVFDEIGGKGAEPCDLDRPCPIHDLAHVVDPQPGDRDANDPEAETFVTPSQTASASGSPPRLRWLNPFVQIVGHPGETSADA